MTYFSPRALIGSGRLCAESHVHTLSLDIHSQTAREFSPHVLALLQPVRDFASLARRGVAPRRVASRFRGWLACHPDLGWWQSRSAGAPPLGRQGSSPRLRIHRRLDGSIEDFRKLIGGTKQGSG